MVLSLSSILWLHCRCWEKKKKKRKKSPKFFFQTGCQTMKQSYHKVRPWAETYTFIREILSLAMWNRCLMVERIIRPMCGWIERGGSISKYQKSAKGCCFWELLINQNQVKVVQNIFVLFVRYHLCLEFFFFFFFCSLKN